MGGTTPKQASPSPKIKGVATPHLNINIFFLKEKAQEDKAHKRNFKDKRVLKKKKKNQARIVTRKWAHTQLRRKPTVSLVAV